MLMDVFIVRDGALLGRRCHGAYIYPARSHVWDGHLENSLNKLRWGQSWYMIVMAYSIYAFVKLDAI